MPIFMQLFMQYSLPAKIITNLLSNGPVVSGGEGGIRTPDTGFASVTA
jgi:hypothetical protein